MGMLAVHHSLVLAAIVAPAPAVPVEGASAHYSLPARPMQPVRLVARQTSEPAALPRILPSVPVNDGFVPPSITWQRGTAYFEMSPGGLRFDLDF